MVIESIVQDLRHAIRGFLRAPAFTLAALLALTLGIGSTTAVFSAVDRILFRSLPYPHDERLVSFGMMAPLDTNEFVLSADWFDWRTAAAPFESMTTFTPGGGACDLAEDSPIRLQCIAVEATFLKTFGIAPVIGRDFTLDEDRPGGSRVAIISYEVWKGRYGGAANIAGRSIPLDGIPTTVIGVLPSHFEMPNLGKADVLIPQALPFIARSGPQSSSGRPLRAFARLKPNVTVAQARAVMQPIFEKSLEGVPPAFRHEVTFRIRSLHDRQVQDVQLASWVLLGSVLAVLLIACANISNLLLARASVRRREFAVRAAIGAGRGRLVRQSLTESLVLALSGCTLGCGLAFIILRIIVTIAPQGIPRIEQMTLDLRSLAFAVGVSVLSSLIFGLAPAWNSLSTETLVQRGATGTKGVVRQFLVAVQIAVSLILLTTAGLLVRTLWNLQSVPLGMRTESVVATPINLGRQRYPQPRQQRVFIDELEQRLASTPGLGEVAVSDSVPLGGTVSDITGQLGTRSTLYAGIEVEGRPAVVKETGGLVAWRRVTPNYFHVLGIPIIRGRMFVEQDRNSQEQIVIISDALARRVFSNEEAVGKRLRFEPRGPSKTIIGIAANVKNNPGLAGADDPEYYVLRKHDDAEDASRQAAVIIRTSSTPAAASSAIRGTVAAIDASLPVSVYTLDQRVHELAAVPRFNATLFGWFAVIGVSLAAVGLYGVVSFLVAQRIQEIGIRLALGATPENILGLVFSMALRWTVSGIAAGLVGAAFAARVLRTLLFQISEYDPWTLSLTVIIMMATALLAAWLPASRASRTDPMIVLRQE